MPRKRLPASNLFPRQTGAGGTRSAACMTEARAALADYGPVLRSFRHIGTAAGRCPPGKQSSPFWIYISPNRSDFNLDHSDFKMNQICFNLIHSDFNLNHSDFNLNQICFNLNRSDFNLNHFDFNLSQNCFNLNQNGAILERTGGNGEMVGNGK
jgi:hypothetical protein